MRGSPEKTDLRFPVTTNEHLKPAHVAQPISFTLPHDAILARMQGLHLPKDVPDTLRGESPERQLRDGMSTSVPENHEINADKEILYDPFDGIPIGLVSSFPFERQCDASGAGTSRKAEDVNQREQCVHLSRVLDLQNELARMHLEMEGITSGDGKGKSGSKNRSKGKGKADGKPQRSATSDTIGSIPHEGDVEGVDAAGDEEVEKKRAREEQFSQLPDHFDDGREAIQDIMQKLDQLSKALTDFHNLRVPKFEFSKSSPRQNSTTPEMTSMTPRRQTKLSSYTSTASPKTSHSDTPNPTLLQPVPSSIQRPQLSSAMPDSSLGGPEVSVLPASLSRGSGRAGTAPPSLVVNTVQLGKQTDVMDSPVDISLFGLPPVPPALKSITPYLQRAHEIRNQDLIITYWSAYHAAQLGIALKARDTASRDLLFALLSVLEQLKKEIGPSDAIDVEAVSAAYIENFAMKVFTMADNEDRSGSATRSTAKKFLAAANFFEILKIFPKIEISESTEEKTKYAKWKAADIAKAFREHRKPTPGPANSAQAEIIDTTPPASPRHQGSTLPTGNSPSSSSSILPSAGTQRRSSVPEPIDVPSTPDAQILRSDDVEESTSGNWSTMATPGTAYDNSEDWDERAPSMKAEPFEKFSHVTAGSASIPKRAWVEEDVEYDEELESYHTGNDSKTFAGADKVRKSPHSDLPSKPPIDLHDLPPGFVPHPHQDLASSIEQQPTSTYFADQPPSMKDSRYLPVASAPPEHLAAHRQIPFAPAPPSSSSQYLSVSEVRELTPSAIAKIQKHCRFAISALDYEDAAQAWKELRSALALLEEST